MVELYDAEHDELNQEVARRLDAITDEPAVMMRYDSNGDGVLDREEWEVVRSLVRRQVLEEFRAARGEPVEQAPAGPLPVSDDAIADEWGVATDPHIDLTVKEQLSARYDVLHELGKGSQADTFLGRDLKTNRFVAIKELAISRLDDWKSLDLFEREQAVLRELEHPGIPDFVDALELEDEGRKRFFLVQEYIDGETLDAELEHVGHFKPAELVDLAEQVLHILAYLQALDPPVVHRDIKPANLIRRASGQIALVDFGGVQNESKDVGGSTIVGTTGYMPPEQLMGRASKSTDLYALGATLVHVATGHHPANLPQTRSKIDWRKYASIPDPLAEFIDRLIEPIAEDRYASAGEALLALTRVKLPGEGRAENPTNALVHSGDWAVDMAPAKAAWRRPEDSFVALERSVEHLSIRIPARINGRRMISALIAFGIAAAQLIGAPIPTAGIGFVIVSIAAAFGLWNLAFANVSFEFEASPESFKLVERLWGVPFEMEGATMKFKGGRVDRREVQTRYGTRVHHVLQIQSYDSWNDVEVQLTNTEMVWVAAEMNAFASDARKVRIARGHDPLEG